MARLNTDIQVHGTNTIHRQRKGLFSELSPLALKRLQNYIPSLMKCFLKGGRKEVVHPQQWSRLMLEKCHTKSKNDH